MSHPLSLILIVEKLDYKQAYSNKHTQQKKINKKYKETVGTNILIARPKAGLERGQNIHKYIMSWDHTD